MHYNQEGPSVTADQSQESFLGSFDRVSSGLDPTQVYSHFIKMSARVRQLEEQTKQVSAPFLLEAALREAAEVRTQSAQAAERTYNEIVRVAEEEAARIKQEAERQASHTLEAARTALDDVQLQADQLIEQARREAEQIRRDADTFNEQTEQELERLCVDFANFLQRLLDRRNASRGSGGSASADAAEGAVAGLAQEPTAAVEPQEAPTGSVGPLPWTPPAVAQDVATPTASQEQPETVAERLETSTSERPNGTQPWASHPVGSAPAEWTPAPAASFPASTPPAPAVESVGQTQQPPRSDEQPTEQNQDPNKPDQEQKGFRLPSWLDM